MLQSSNIFAHLLDEPDSGETVPNPTFLYRVQKLGLDSFPFTELRGVGTPYIWVQNLAGLVFPKFGGSAEEHANEDLNFKVDETICQSKVTIIAWQKYKVENVEFFPSITKINFNMIN